MKRNVLFLLISLCLLSSEIFAQQPAFKPFGNRFNFEYWSSGFAGSYGFLTLFVPDTALSDALRKLPMMKPKSPLILGVKLSTSTPDNGLYQIKSISKSYSGYLISDSSEAVIVAMGINRHNINEFQYHVVENDSIEVVPWSKIPRLAQHYGAKQPHGFIGAFKSPGKSVLIEVRNTKNYGIRDGIIFDWRVNPKPKLEDILVIGRRDKRLFQTHLREHELNLGLAKHFDPRTHVPIDFKFSHGRILNIQLYLENHQQVPFDITIYKVGVYPKITVYRDYALTDNFKDILITGFDSPGKYEIIIARSESIDTVTNENVLVIPFEITPKSFTDINVSMEFVIVFSIILILVFGIIFSAVNRKNKRRVQKIQQEQQVAALKLKSIRSQLNPHFMFNALTSIQNLINKNNITDANFYLSKFAGLTRQVLDSNNENLLSLEDEVRLLTDYLEMEQLRFDFQYVVEVDPALNQANIEVPAMLLQPFVENAVKHGVSGLKHSGLVKIFIKGIDTNLEMRVEDNGAGYARNIASPGYGIKLSEERVEILNQLYKDQSISLTTDSTATGTVITIRLSNWLS